MSESICYLCIEKDASEVVSRIIDLKLNLLDINDIKIFIKINATLAEKSEGYREAVVQRVMEII